ncbi:hypothetical protein [Mesorhizobium helmanticense]|uniref:hypothetical protein n=1 Tax=Mesorhizobium helmanticense TaxID=1776423 RepID=UPI001FE227E6|nr:hypothetical protein [Mesorhizobium helmanticense]
MLDRDQGQRLRIHLGDAAGGYGIYAVNFGFYNAIDRVYAKYFSANPLARSFVPVAS